MIAITLDVSDVIAKTEKAIREIEAKPLGDPKLLDKSVREHLDVQFEKEGFDVQQNSRQFSGNTKAWDARKARIAPLRKKQGSKRGKNTKPALKTTKSKAPAPSTKPKSPARAFRNMTFREKLRRAVKAAAFDRRKTATGDSVYRWRWLAMNRGFDYSDKFQNGLDVAPKGDPDTTNPPHFKDEGRKLVITDRFVRRYRKVHAVPSVEAMIEKAY